MVDVTSTTLKTSVVGPDISVGSASTDKLGFFGLAAPVVKQGGSALATISISALTASSPYGFASAADGNLVVNQLKAITAALAAYGIILQA